VQEESTGWDPARSRIYTKKRMKYAEFGFIVVRFRKKEREPGVLSFVGGRVNVLGDENFIL
jgi:hypothetical protein